MKISNDIINRSLNSLPPLSMHVRYRDQQAIKKEIAKRLGDSLLHQREMFSLAYKTLKPLVKKEILLLRAIQLWDSMLLKFYNCPVIFPELQRNQSHNQSYAIAYLNKYYSYLCNAFYLAIIELQFAADKPIQFNLDLAHYDLIVIKAHADDLTALQKTVNSPLFENVHQLTTDKLETIDWHSADREGEVYIEKCKVLANLRNSVNRGTAKYIEIRYKKTQNKLYLLCPDKIMWDIFYNVSLETAKSLAQQLRLPLIPANKTYQPYMPDRLNF